MSIESIEEIVGKYVFDNIGVEADKDWSTEDLQSLSKAIEAELSNRHCSDSIVESFAGLPCRDETVIVGAKHDAGVWARLVDEFCNMNQLAKYLTFHLVLKPLIKRNYRLRKLGKLPDEWYWADNLAISCGFIGAYPL